MDTIATLSLIMTVTFILLAVILLVAIHYLWNHSEKTDTTMLDLIDKKHDKENEQND